jgi:hypothetical protein
MKIKRLLFLVLPLACVFLVGCRTSSTPGNLSGVVKHKGSPLRGGTITFCAPEGGTYGPARIKGDGTYAISGLPVGELVVVVETDSANPKNQISMDQYGQGKKPNIKDPNAPKDKDAKDPKDAKIGPGRGRPADIPAGGAGEPGKFDAIPEKYNRKETSTLKVDVVAGSQTKNFDVD